MTSLFMNRYEDLPPGWEDLAKKLERRGGEGRRDGDSSTNGSRPALTMKTLTALIAVGGMLFAAGENWHRIDALTDEFHTHVQQNREDHATFANRSTADEHFDSLQRQIEDVKQLVLRQQARR